MNHIRKKKKRKDYLLEEALEEIRKEIYKYSPDVLIEFMKLFPCEKEKYKFPIGFDDSNKIIVKGASAGSIFFYHPYHYTKYLTCSSVEDFWIQWSRFKKLRIFL